MAEPIPTRRKVSDVAKEFKVTTGTLIEYLETKGYETKRGPNTPITEDIFLVLLQKFDPARFQKVQTETVTTRDQDQRRDSERLRAQEQAELLAARKEPAEPVAATPTKIPLPKITRMTVVSPAVEKVAEVAPAEPPQPPVKPAPSKAAKKLEEQPQVPPKERERQPQPTPEPVTPPVVVAEQVPPPPVETRPAESPHKPAQKRRKIELPKAKPLVIVSPAPRPEPEAKQKRPPKEREEVAARTPKQPEQSGKKQKKFQTILDLTGGQGGDAVVGKRQAEPSLPTEQGAPRKKLKRKKVVSVIETPEDAIEKEFETKITKEDKTPRAKGAIKKQDTSSKRRHRKKKAGPAAVAEPAPETRILKPAAVDRKAVSKSVRATMAKVEGRGTGKRKYVRSHSAKSDEQVVEAVEVTEFMTTQELSNVLGVPVQDIIRKGLEMGSIMSINQRLDHDTIELLVAEIDPALEIEFVQEEEIGEEEEADGGTGKKIARQPVVTVMGHVDHGKTTLLDTLRKSRITEGEAGGITQHIGAYEVTFKDRKITFLDTPGHEAFTAMRARGAQVTDLVVLVVAADDRVMPQTVEAINHARAAGVPIVIAVNKVDKPSSNTDAIYTQLADQQVLVEKWGGKYQSAEISAKFGQGLDNLLEEILTAADTIEGDKIMADPTARARGTIIESRLDKGLGAVATLLVHNGTLHVGDIFVAGQYYGRVRTMYDEYGDKVERALPGAPVQIVGFNGVPQAGDRLTVYESEKEAHEISQRRQIQQRAMSRKQISALSLDQVNNRMREEKLQELPLIIKGDVHGSVEVLSDSLQKLSNNEVKVNIIHRGVGAITESDILLAAASGAIVIGFHVHPNPQAREVARKEGVEIRIYRIIHEVVDEVKNSLEGMLAPEQHENVIGQVEVRQVFKISRVGAIAGSYVTDGKITRSAKVRLIRDDIEIWSDGVAGLRRFKDDAREVVTGFECGITLDGFSDVKVGDRLEVFEIITTSRKLEPA